MAEKRQWFGTAQGGKGIVISKTQEVASGEMVQQDRLLEFLRARRLISFEWDLSSDTVVRSANADEILGPDTTRDTGASFFSRVHAEDRERLSGVLQTLVPERADYVATYRYLRETDGQELLLEDSGRAEFDASGKMVRVRGAAREVTEQKRTEEAVRSVALFPEENPFPVARVDSEGKLLFANRASLGLLAEWGCKASGLVPESVRVAVREALAAEDTRELTSVVGGRTISLMLVPIGARGYVNLYGRDVTEQTRAQEELRTSEAKYRSLFNSIDDGFCIIEVLFGADEKAHDYRFLEVNPAFEKHTGLSDAVGKCVREIVPNQDAHWFETYGSVALTGESKRFAARGEALRRYFEVYAFRVGEPEERRVAVLFRDETQRKQAEDAVRESQEKLRQAAELVGLCPYTWEPETGSLEWSEGIRELWGLPPEAKVDFSVWQAGIHPEDRAFVEERVARCLDPKGDGKYEAEYRVKAADGVERWVSVQGRTRFADGKAASHIGVAVDATNRRKDQEAVRKKAEELRAVLDAAPVAVWIAQDPECRVITGNAYADELIMGTERGGNISRSAPEGEASVTYRVFRDGIELSPEDLPAQQAVATAAPVPGFDMELLFSDGRKLSLMAGAIPLFDAVGKVRGAVVAGLDVTALKKTQEELRQAEERARFALQAGRMGTWDRIMPHGPTAWNADHYRILGYDPAQVTPSKQAWEARVHPDDLSAFYEGLSGVLEHGGVFSEEIRLVLPERQVRWVEMRGCIQCDAKGQPIRSCGVVLDLTDRRRAEQALRKSEEHFRSITDTTPVIMWMTDATGSMEFVNRAYREFFGVTLEQVSGPGKWQPLVHPQDAASYLGAYAEALRKQCPFMAEARVRRADGQWRWIHSHGAPRFDEKGQFLGMAGSSPDITERKEFQAELERLVAERTAKLRELVGELEHFSYTITHDLKSPLRAMRGFAELMSLNCEACHIGEAKDFLNRISTAAERMDRLIADALSYSRAVRQELPLEDVDAGKLLRGMLDSYPELQPEKARIVVEGRLPVVLANQAGLTQCFSNLLGNAVKFAKRGEMPDIRVWASRQEGWVRIWVEDKGIGIAKEMLPRVFDMFVRGSKDYDGTGIGLALVRKAAQRMGGKAGVESEEGKGSRFWIELKSGEVDLACRRVPCWSRRAVG